MSGPKISVYELSGRAREIFFGQIHCEQQSIICYDRIQTIINELKTFLRNYDKYVATDALVSKRLGISVSDADKLLALRNRAEQELKEIEKRNTRTRPTISAKYTISEAAYEAKQAELDRLKRIKELAEAVGLEVEKEVSSRTDATASLQKSILEDLSALNSTEEEKAAPHYASRDSENDTKKIQESIYRDFVGVGSFSWEPDEVPEETKESDFVRQKKELTKLLETLGTKYAHEGPLVAEIHKAHAALQRITEASFLHSFMSISMKSLNNKIESFEIEKQKALADFNELLSRYKILCSMANVEGKRYSISDTDALSDAISEIEHLILAQQEQTYVSECVDQVMAEMGYDLIGSREVVKKKTGKRFRNELYTFNEGTAVNVTYSSDGQIAMELGGIAREDRIPTADETEMLTQDMQSFCSEFAEFERRLSAKGVVVNHRIALSPPSADYAAIINVSDYTVTEGTQITEMKTVDRKKKATEKKVLRRTE